MRFAILHHTDIAAPHYDLLIETGPEALLLTFRLEQWPVTGATEVVRQADHRRIYLDYEGPISGGRGQVRRVAGGECTVGTLTATTATVTLHLDWPLRLQFVHREADRWRLAVSPAPLS